MAGLPTANAQTTLQAPMPASSANAEVSTPQGSVGTVNAPPEVAAFDIVVRAPAAIRDLLENHLELQRFRAVTDLDDTELARLLVLAERNVQNLVGTLGFFSPKITITRETGPDQRLTIVVAVEPGEGTVTSTVDIRFAGDIAESEDPDAVAQRTQIKDGWRLARGQRFTQSAWDGAKNQALRELVVRRYPAGTLTDSLADIDPATRSAALSAKLDSGPLYRLGPLQVTGIQRYDPVLVPNLARLTEGDVYDQEELLRAQQRLSSSGYFDSAYIFIDPGSDPAAAPVQVRLRETKLQKVILGVGMTTDNGPRASIEHTHHRVPGIDWRAVTTLQLEKKAPFAQTEWTSIPDAAAWRWSTLGRAERADDDDLITDTHRLRFGRLQTGDHIDRNIYLQYDRSRVTGSGLLGNSAADAGDGSALTANYVWTGRYFDSLPFPANGYGLGFEVGGGTTLRNGRTLFSRLVARWLGIHSLERGRIAMRAETGAVLAKDTTGIPSAQLFRTGGDSTVRGYGYRDIGISLANGVIGPGSHMAVGSVEWQRPMLRDGRPTEWENTVFIDAGAVGDKLRDLSPSVGVGTGVRWRSPIGPLQIDLAYGVKVSRVRMHLSVGFVF